MFSMFFARFIAQYENIVYVILGLFTVHFSYKVLCITFKIKILQQNLKKKNFTSDFIM